MSSTLIVPVAVVDSVSPHPNADKLAIARILGWRVVSPKDNIGLAKRSSPPDTVLPETVSARFGVTQYLSHGRVRCARLRGELSFGLCSSPDNPDWPVGANVAASIRRPNTSRLCAPVLAILKGHPLFQRYTDVENLRHFPDAFAWANLSYCPRRCTARAGV